jgi:rfaE bifunctional protein kinase chain/domain
MTEPRCAQILASSSRVKVLVLGDLILDHFIWGFVKRISPEAPVPIVEFQRESFMPGGAANVALNLRHLGAKVDLFGVVGRDEPGSRLSTILSNEGVGVRGLICSSRPTTVKMRIVSKQQQITRLDRELIADLDQKESVSMDRRLQRALKYADAVIVGDYGKGVVNQAVIDGLKIKAKERGCWVSIDPKPTHALDLSGMSLITPNRREAFALAGYSDNSWNRNPLKDRNLLRTAKFLMEHLGPKVLLVTLGELGMLLCSRSQPIIHIHTAAKEVFDVSGAGDTVIASFTVAIASGSTPFEAAEISNQAAGIVVGKFGTATVTSRELTDSFRRSEGPKD